MDIDHVIKLRKESHKRITVYSFESIKTQNIPAILMTVIKIGIKIISELKSFVSFIVRNDELLNKFRKSEKDFTRSRKLPFERLVLLVAKLCKKTLSLKIESFFEVLGVTDSCSVSAFTQQRSKLKSSFFIGGTLFCRVATIIIAGQQRKDRKNSGWVPLMDPR